MNCMSMARKPSPWHVSHRPPSTLKLKWPAVRSARARVNLFGEQRADRVERLEIRRRIRSRRTTDRALVDENDVFHLPSAKHVVIRQRLGQIRRDRHSFLTRRARCRVECLIDERAFAGAADARNQAQHAERKLDGHVLQIVSARAAQLHPSLGRRATLPAAESAPPGEPVACSASLQLFPVLAACLGIRFARRPRRRRDRIPRPDWLGG